MMLRFEDLLAEIEFEDRAYARLTLSEKLVTPRFWRKLWANIRGAVGLAWYWVRCHTYDRYHVINVSGQAGYRWGWQDRDFILLAACFKILVDFVDQEEPEVGLVPARAYAPDDAPADWAPDEQLEHQLAGNAEIRALYVWWTQERPARVDPGNDASNILVLQDAYQEEDQRMLHRLVEVRLRLWA